MRKIIIFLLVILSISGIKAQDALQQAQKAYEDGDFGTSINLYEKEISTNKDLGKVSSDLYYNLGNAYFKNNNIPQAILNYERALLYNPTNKDIKHNLEYANTKIEDKITEVDSFSLSHLFNLLAQLTSSNAWAIFAIISFILLLSMLTLYFFGKKIILKKIGFYASLVLLFFVVFCNLFAFKQKNAIEDRNLAIIVAGVVSVLSSPTQTSNEVFVLHAGTKVKVRKVDGEWLEIEIKDGSVGWINSSKLEII